MKNKLLSILSILTLLSCNETDMIDKYLDDPAVDRILVVHHTEGSKANAKFYTKAGDRWQITLECPAIIGKNGIGKTREGDGKTPIGDFAVTGAFGIKPNPGCALSYTDITPTTFACDEDGPYYNTIVDTAEIHHNCKGEAMYDFDPQYRFGLTIDYNPECIYPAGSAIFIHCRGDKDYTAGCVAIGENELVKILKESHKGMRVIIY